MAANTERSNGELDWEKERAVLKKQMHCANVAAYKALQERDALLEEKSVWEKDLVVLKKQMHSAQVEACKALQERDALLEEKGAWEKERAFLQQQRESAYIDATDDVRNSLSKYFSSSQITSILTAKPVKLLQDEDISKALTLRSLSPKAYRYLREKVGFPFPSSSTLHRWVSKLNVEPGVLHSVVKMLQHKADSMSEPDRLCVLSFDETSVSQEWTYDKGADTLYGPKKKLSVP